LVKRFLLLQEDINGYLARRGAACMTPSSGRFVAFLKSRNIQEKYVATIPCKIYCISYLAIYRLFNVKQLKEDM